MGELGFLGLKYPEAYGGQGGDYLHDAVLTEELARCGSGGTAAGHRRAHLDRHAARLEVRHRRPEAALPARRRSRGDEHRRARDHRAGRRLRRRGAAHQARETEDGWVLNGSKMFITNGVRADWIVCAAKTTPEGGHGGISFFIVDTDQPGYGASAIEKLGWRASDTALIALDDVFVPQREPARRAARRLQADHGQLPVGAAGRWRSARSSAMQVCLERTLEYAGERSAFGRPIAKHPGDPPQVRRDGDEDRGRAAR